MRYQNGNVSLLDWMLRMFLLPHREILQTHPILKEHLKLRRITDVFTLYAWVFVSDSLLHMLPYKIQKIKSKSLCNKKAFNSLFKLRI